MAAARTFKFARFAVILGLVSPRPGQCRRRQNHRENPPSIKVSSIASRYALVMDLTVCVCTHNRPRYVRDCLDGLRRQTVPPDRFAVSIVDSFSPEPARSALVRLAAAYPGATLIRVDAPGVSAARNAGATASATDFIAYIDDDAIPADDWVAAILGALASLRPSPAVIAGRILPRWEAPLPAWWPRSLRGVLSIIEHEGQGEFRTKALPRRLEPYACNMIVHVPSLLAAGGFGGGIGRIGEVLLSDEEVQLAWRLQDSGLSVRYDSRIVVTHQIQANRLNPAWLLSRLYWQGASTVLTRRLLHQEGAVWRELPRRLLVAALCAPAALAPRQSTRLLAARWRWAYAAGFIRAALGWRAADTARRLASHPLPSIPAVLIPLALIPLPLIALPIPVQRPSPRSAERSIR
jgi:GT2 family glycosyltransferase